MKTIMSFLFVLVLSISSYAQEKNITPQNKLQADIKNGTVTLYVLSGIVSSATPADKGFLEKYNVKYHDFGCVIPENIDYYREYNLLVLQYLKKKFGTKWEKDVRKNILGSKEWKTKK
ncbi:FEKKY domain-containing protein [Flavobacterium cerinum]|uniref:DUF4296 domain-containing protein n=1 Tax=Flavobacterium cerinum TaxID=2502784 RepID=A0A444HE19_9FLAO|nr:hypothetical protein [Flavobacterium cerinum]RWX02531.1 hypothetical protein EPI11_04750 [Flavobacterium cerinum]